MDAVNIGIFSGYMLVAAIALTALFCIRASNDAEKDLKDMSDRRNWHHGIPHIVYTSVRNSDIRQQRRDLRRAKRVRARRKES